MSGFQQAPVLFDRYPFARPMDHNIDPVRSVMNLYRNDGSFPLQQEHFPPQNVIPSSWINPAQLGSQFPSMSTISDPLLQGQAASDWYRCSFPQETAAMQLHLMETTAPEFCEEKFLQDNPGSMDIIWSEDQGEYVLKGVWDPRDPSRMMSAQKTFERQQKLKSQKRLRPAPVHSMSRA